MPDPYNPHVFCSISMTLWARKKEFLKIAKRLGLDTMLWVAHNVGFVDQMRPEWVGVKSHEHRVQGQVLCPSIPQAREVCLQNHKNLFCDLLQSGVEIDKVCFGPYDDGGCACELCQPYYPTFLSMVTEIMDISQLPYFDDVDVIQVGTRNMQNFELLKSLGRTQKPVLLKRGFANTIEELLMAADHIMSAGNPNVILCERGIRTFETATRNTLDISAIPVIKKLSHLPVVVDPSHASGSAWLVPPLAKAAVAAGADGLIIEVHPEPEKALSDGAQSLTPDAFDELMGSLRSLAPIVGRSL
ncbi:MAG: hypothetical protein EOM52_11960 [Clostridia bacterium]|nr:hypothetical protein [Clostridia bacterium]